MRGFDQRLALLGVFGEVWVQANRSPNPRPWRQLPHDHPNLVAGGQRKILADQDRLVPDASNGKTACDGF
jgi:hypothetical protein